MAGLVMPWMLSRRTFLNEEEGKKERKKRNTKKRMERKMSKQQKKKGKANTKRQMTRHACDNHLVPTCVQAVFVSVRFITDSNVVLVILLWRSLCMFVLSACHSFFIVTCDASLRPFPNPFHLYRGRTCWMKRKRKEKKRRRKLLLKSWLEKNWKFESAFVVKKQGALTSLKEIAQSNINPRLRKQHRRG